MLDAAAAEPPGSGAAAAPGASPHLPLNPSGHAISLTVPVTDGTIYLGDIAMTIDKDDQISMPAARLFEVLSPALSPEALARLQAAFSGHVVAALGAFPAADIALRYDTGKIELAVGIPTGLRSTRAIQIASLGREHFGDYEHPAAFSAYLNVKGSLDYIERGANAGLATPILYLDGAARFNGVVLETQATFQSDAPSADFQRQGSRLVYDDQDHLVRWMLGDLRPLSTGFQSAPDMAGIGVFRTYGVLQPQTIARPSGRRSFRLDRPSTVEISVNGQIVRRLHLDPGIYNLSDFPFTQGVDDVRIAVTDDTGRTETLQFNLFADQTQLAEGLTEFGAYAGMKAPPGPSGPLYSHDAEVTGFYRHGFSDQLTLGANFQADAHSALLGMDSVFSVPFGAFGANVAASKASGTGTGVASTFTFQTMLRGKQASTDSFHASLEMWSRNFGPIDALLVANPYTYRIGASYSHAFNEAFYAGLNLSYAKARPTYSSGGIYGVTFGWRVSPSITLDTQTGYQNAIPNLRGGFSTRLTLTVRMDANASVMATYDSRAQTERLAYQTQQGEGAGSYNILAAVEHSPGVVGLNGSANFLTSLAELGFDHFQNFGGGANSSTDARSVLRFGSSASFADGAFSVGRPIYDSFAIVTRHETLKDAVVVLDPTPYGYTAQTTVLGTVTEPVLNSYNERTITVDAPDAPIGVDLGKGAFRILPPYRSGYRLQVGSEYSVSVVGRELNDEGQPVAFAAGTATELALPAREAVELFTNREGRFGIAGLRPGRWRVDMQSSPPTSYLLTIPADATGAVRLGDIRPSSEVKP